MIKNDVPSNSEDKLQEGNKAGDKAGHKAWRESLIFWHFPDWLFDFSWIKSTTIRLGLHLL